VLYIVVLGFIDNKKSQVVTMIFIAAGGRGSRPTGRRKEGEDTRSKESTGARRKGNNGNRRKRAGEEEDEQQLVC